MDIDGNQVEDALLDTHLGSDEAPASVEVEVEAEIRNILPVAFQVCSPETASWVVRRITNARNYAKKVKLWAELECRRAQHEEQRLLFLFGGQLRDWTQAEVQRVKSRRRSIGLPGGTVGFRTVPSRLVIHDEALVLRWARTACPKAIVVTENHNTRSQVRRGRIAEPRGGLSGVYQINSSISNQPASRIASRVFRT
ncbi:MAG TPA: hypothetical protein VF624_01020 [Tepidisphaeraceae bacterium]|jgi:hypothetical protein